MEGRLESLPSGFEARVPDGRPSQFDNHIQRRLSALRNQFADQEAFEEMVTGGDPIIYEVYEMRRPAAAGDRPNGLSIVHPGRVGSEYFMTKGHYHAIRDTAEIYYCLAGTGVLLMENEAGQTAVEEFHRGRVVYVLPRWAHRSINTGNDEDLVTFFVYPGHAGHDYSTIEATGFRKRVVCGAGAPVVVDNARISGEPKRSMS
jgi:glucose-6-phosphate isomerase